MNVTSTGFATWGLLGSSPKKSLQRRQSQSSYSMDSIRFSAAQLPPVSSASVAPSPKRLHQDVATLVQWLRNPEHMDELNQSADYIKGQWEKLGLTVTEQKFRLGDKEFRNLMVSFGPQNAPRFIVGAHYDVFKDQPGADDNASGVAGLLELSRLLAEHKPPLKTRLDLVAYTLEEPPYSTYGSQIHAQSLLKAKVPLKGMISLEMIGYYSDKPNSQHFPSKVMRWFYPDKGNFIALVGYGKALGLLNKTQQAFKQFSTLPARKLYMPINLFGMDRSDHNHFANAGIPAIMVTDTAEHRNFNYHKTSDTIYTLDFPKMAEVVKGVYNLVRRM